MRCAAAAAGAGRLRGGLELLCLLRCSLGRAEASGLAALPSMQLSRVSLAAAACRTKSVGCTTSGFSALCGMLDEGAPTGDGGHARRLRRVRKALQEVSMEGQLH